jgi:hypothetical protein
MTGEPKCGGSIVIMVESWKETSKKMGEVKTDRETRAGRGSKNLVKLGRDRAFVTDDVRIGKSQIL